MFRELDISVNNQILRILLAIFDHNNDQKISKDEFTALLQKYVKKEPIKAEQITSNVIGLKDAEELAEMYNQDIREKAVHENFDFDFNDIKQIIKREQ